MEYTTYVHLNCTKFGICVTWKLWKEMIGACEQEEHKQECPLLIPGMLDL